MSNPIIDALPPSLNLPPHLSAHKYFLVCTLTVAAWDTLVLSPRTWRLMRQPGWPALKSLFCFLRVFMPAEFIIVAVFFFNTKFTAETCQKFFLFEPICTAILLACTSAVHVIRIKAIYENSRSVLAVMAVLFAAQVIVTAISCGFFRSVPLDVGQGCIAGPVSNWVGIYWVAPTLLYSVSFGLALMRSIESLKARPLSPWKLMLRDGLNLYAAIFLVNMANMIFWFVMKATGPSDPVKTIVTSMAAVLTTSMTLRIILNIRSSLAYGGSFALSASSSNTRGNQHSGANPSLGLSSRSNAVTSSNVNGLNLSRGGVQSISTHSAPAHTYTLDEMRSKPEGEWGVIEEDKSSVGDKRADLVDEANQGVRVTVDREVADERAFPHAK